MCGACEPIIYAKSEKDISPVWLKDGRSWDPAIDVTKLKHLYIDMTMCCLKCEEIIVENIEDLCGVFGAHAERQKDLVTVVLATVDDPCNKSRKRVLQVAQKIDRKAKFVDPPKPIVDPSKSIVKPDVTTRTPTPPPTRTVHPPKEKQCKCVCCNAANWIIPKGMWPPDAHAPVCHQACTALCYDNWYPAKPWTDQGYPTVFHYPVSGCPRYVGCFFCCSHPFNSFCSFCGRTVY